MKIGSSIEAAAASPWISRFRRLLTNDRERRTRDEGNWTGDGDSPASRPVPPLPPDLHAIGGSERLAQDAEEMLGGAAVAEDVDGGLVDPVVLVVGSLLFEAVDEHLEIGVGNGFNQFVGIVPVDINHRDRSSRRRASTLRTGQLVTVLHVPTTAGDSSEA